MFGNWAQETTTGTGTGTLTLAAVTGKPRVADVFPVGELVSYAILDSDGNPIEGGIGTVGASNTLTRTIVRATYVSGTYTGANATAVSLAAGTKTVIATPVSGTFAGTIPAINTSAAQRLIHSHHGLLNSIDTRSLGSGNDCFFMPFEMRHGCDADAIVCNVTASGAGNLRMGLYLVDIATGKPGTRILQSGDVSGSTTGIKVATFTRRHITPGWYYIAIAAKGVAMTVRAYAAAYLHHPTPLGYADFGNPYSWATQTLSGGWTDLPNPAAPTFYGAVGADYAPCVALRAA